MHGTTAALRRQHLIDPEVCIRCNTCEEVCGVRAISHNGVNYAVDFDLCNFCGDCLPPCPTGAIDNYRQVARPWTVSEQFGWETLPPDQVPGDAAIAGESPAPSEAPIPAEVATSSEIHHIVLELGTTAMPVLEGQSIGVLPPGLDADGKPHRVRLYSVASPREGERPGKNNIALTVKRVVEDHDGRPVRGVASNYLCDLAKGDEVRLIGPYGTSFLMPNHPGAHIVMICTGTGAAPMRAMTERRRRKWARGEDSGGKLLLFFGARTPGELPYFGPLTRLPRDFIDDPAQPRAYVQDRLRARAGDLVGLLSDGNAYFYLCGHKRMEEGVEAAFAAICGEAGLHWPQLKAELRRGGRYHVETY
jgi:benzoyl-CoA 2,3-dioxygenase component A